MYQGGHTFTRSLLGGGYSIYVRHCPWKVIEFAAKFDGAEVYFAAGRLAAMHLIPQQQYTYIIPFLRIFAAADTCRSICSKKRLTFSLKQAPYASQAKAFGSSIQVIS